MKKGFVFYQLILKKYLLKKAMKRKDYYRIINEEIREFDFLGINELQDDNAEEELVHSKEFQTQFVFDVINDFDNIDKFNYDFTSNSQDSNSKLDIYDGETIDSDFEITYKFNGEEISLYVIIEGSNIKNFDDLVKQAKIKFFSQNGATVDFPWLIKNEKLFSQFLRSLYKKNLIFVE